MLLITPAYIDTEIALIDAYNAIFNDIENAVDFEGIFNKAPLFETKEIGEIANAISGSSAITMETLSFMRRVWVELQTMLFVSPKRKYISTISVAGIHVMVVRSIISATGDSIDNRYITRTASSYLFQKLFPEESISQCIAETRSMSMTIHKKSVEVTKNALLEIGGIALHILTIQQPFAKMEEILKASGVYLQHNPKGYTIQVDDLLESQCIVCSSIGKYRCGDCMTQIYCSKECQIEDWNNEHKINCL